MKKPRLGTVHMQAAGRRNTPTRRATFTPDKAEDALPDLVDVTIRAIMEDEIVLAGISIGRGELGVYHYAQAWRVRPAVLGEAPPANRTTGIKAVRRSTPDSKLGM